MPRPLLRPSHVDPAAWRRLALVAAGGVETAAWEGPLTVEGSPTGDGRFFQPDALSWADLPLPLMWAPSLEGGHDGAVVVGLIYTITRRDDGVIWGTGVWDLGSDDGREAQRLAAAAADAGREVDPDNPHGFGVSVDLDSVSYQVEISQELADELTGDAEVPDIEFKPGSEPGRVVLYESEHDESLMVVTAGRIRSTTMVPIPAYAEAMIWPADAAAAEPAADEPAPVAASALDQSWVLTASAKVPDFPPAAWLTDPKLSGPTPLTVTDDGRVFGHAALWESCHVGFAAECVAPPRSATGYAHFHLGVLRTDDGADVPVGHITLGTGHAGQDLAAAAAAAHYDNTGTVVADVHAGEDAYGIWVAGALRPEVTTRQLRELRSAPLSGDWRAIRGNLELVAALAVNVPGFGIPRAQGALAASVAGAPPRPLSLVAAGVVQDCDRSPSGLSADEVATLRRLAAQETARRRELVAAAAPGIRDQAAAVLARRAGVR